MCLRKSNSTFCCTLKTVEALNDVYQFIREILHHNVPYMVNNLWNNFISRSSFLIYFHNILSCLNLKCNVDFEQRYKKKKNTTSIMKKLENWSNVQRQHLFKYQSCPSRNVTVQENVWWPHPVPLYINVLIVCPVYNLNIAKRFLSWRKQNLSLILCISNLMNKVFTWLAFPPRFGKALLKELIKARSVVNWKEVEIWLIETKKLSSFFFVKGHYLRNVYKKYKIWFF